MKIKNLPLIKTVKKMVCFTRETDKGEKVTLPFLLGPLPMGFDAEVEALLPEPLPPAKGWLREKGKIVRDDIGAPVQVYDYNDAGYTARLMEVKRLRTVLMLQTSLSADENVLWETPCPSPLTKDNATEYYRLIYEEMKQFGLTLSEFNRLTVAMMELSTLSAEKVEVAAEGFLPEQ